MERNIRLKDLETNDILYPQTKTTILIDGDGNKYNVPYPDTKTTETEKVTIDSNGKLWTKHIDIDSEMSNTSENPVQNKIIKAYVDAETTRAEGVEASLESTKQDKTDNSLNTTDKTVVGAINELKTTTDTLNTNKQNITDNSLTTTNKTIPTAINEINTNLSSHTSNTSNPHSVTKEQVGLGSVVNAGQTSSPTESSNEYFTAGGAYTLQQSLNSSISTKQDKTDESLSTTNKTVVGAINEINQNLSTSPTNIDLTSYVDVLNLGEIFITPPTNGFFTFQKTLTSASELVNKFSTWPLNKNVSISFKTNQGWYLTFDNVQIGISEPDSISVLSGFTTIMINGGDIYAKLICLFGGSNFAISIGFSIGKHLFFTDDDNDKFAKAFESPGTEIPSDSDTLSNLCLALQSGYSFLLGQIHFTPLILSESQVVLYTCNNQESRPGIVLLIVTKTYIKAIFTELQTTTSDTLTTTSKEIVGAINELKTSTDNLSSSKQNINDNALTTTSKTVPGAINELKTKADSLQSQITSNDSDITNLTNNKQDKTDSTLTTNTKTIVGAINEVNANINSFVAATDEEIRALYN